MPWLLLCVLAFVSPALGGGPEVGSPAPALTVFDVTGGHAGQDADYAAERKDLPTLYVFIQAERWDRPTARFLRALDQAIAKRDDNAYLVAVWLTDDVDKTKQYLPIAQQSLQLSRTALTCFTAGKEGPKDWKLDLGAALAVVVAAKGKVADARDYRSVNETVAPEIIEAFDKAAK